MAARGLSALLFLSALIWNRWLIYRIYQEDTSFRLVRDSISFFDFLGHIVPPWPPKDRLTDRGRALRRWLSISFAATLVALAAVAVVFLATWDVRGE